MPSFRYRALTQSGDVVSGVIAAKTMAEVSRRIDYLRLVPIDPIQMDDDAGSGPRWDFKIGGHPRPEDITTFTLDLALLLKAGARLDDALELLATDADIGRLRATISKVRSGVLAGETFSEALAGHPKSFPPMYLALIRVGESSGALAHMLEVLARERSRAETLRRKLADALRYPVFLLFAATAALVFFLTFVLPQFSNVLRDFGAKIDPAAQFFFWLSDIIVGNKDAVAMTAATLLLGAFLAAKQAKLRTILMSNLFRLPVLRTIFGFYRASLFCRNLDVLLAAGVPLTTALRILAEIVQGAEDPTVWTGVIDRVRHGGRLSDSIGEINALPAMAVRMLRLGEETGQLPVLAGRVAEFYETKLQRSIDRAVAFVGPLAIVTISIIIGGLIISVMTSLLSVSQLVG